LNPGQGEDDIFLKILSRCNGRLLKHITALELMLRFVHGRKNQELSSPHFAPGDSSTECSQDIESLGEYCEATHQSYTQLCKDRLERLKELASSVVALRDTTQCHELRSLVKVGYDVRRSGSFKRLVGSNLVRPRNPGIAFPSVLAIVHRIGQISKFYRCAVTLTFAAAKLLELGKVIKVQGIPAGNIQIRELANRTATQLRRRGGANFVDAGGNKLQRNIDRWPKYRTHAEMQLIVFYEENPSLKLYCTYIGCNKQSCYLCYNFIEHHGRFRVDGCHQSLYSLWTVPEAITFAHDQRATNFKHALAWVVADLEQKMRIFRNGTMQRRRFGMQNESVPNLSRMSLGLPEQISRIYLTPPAVASNILAMVLEEVQIETSGGTVGDTMAEAGSKGPEIVPERFSEASQGQAAEVSEQEICEKPEELEKSPSIHPSPTISKDVWSGKPSNETFTTPNSTSPSLSPRRNPEPPTPPSMMSESLLEPGAKGECAVRGVLEAKEDLNVVNATTEHRSVDPIQSRIAQATPSANTSIDLMETLSINPSSPEILDFYETQPQPSHSHPRTHPRHLHHQQRSMPSSTLQTQRKSREQKRKHRNPTKNSSRRTKTEIPRSSAGHHGRKRKQSEMRDDECGCTRGLFQVFSSALGELLRKMRAK